MILLIKGFCLHGSAIGKYCGPSAGGTLWEVFRHSYDVPPHQSLKSMVPVLDLALLYFISIWCQVFWYSNMKVTYIVRKKASQFLGESMGEVQSKGRVLAIHS